jgi:hypothetical protein
VSNAVTRKKGEEKKKEKKKKQQQQGKHTQLSDVGDSCAYGPGVSNIDLPGRAEWERLA